MRMQPAVRSNSRNQISGSKRDEGSTRGNICPYQLLNPSKQEQVAKSCPQATIQIAAQIILNLKIQTIKNLKIFKIKI